MNTLLRWMGVAALACNLSGCISIFLDNARLDADLPLPPPSVAPDSSKSGDKFLQVGLRVSDGTFLSDNSHQWSSFPVGGYGQLQIVGSEHWRWVTGVGASSTASGWTGFVWSTRNQYLRWDIEALVGGTYGTSTLVGRVSGSSDDGETRIDSGLTAHGSGIHGWGQYALRARSIGSGPWVEYRILPPFHWGTLSDPIHKVDDYSVETDVSALTVGWIQEFHDRSLATIGVRAVGFQGFNKPKAQLVASWQMAL